MPKLYPTRRALPLDEEDLANLRESGLSDATINAAGLYTKDHKLYIPYRDLAGNTNCFARWRPHKPRVRDGKPIKYEQPKGSTSRAYFPKSSLPKLRTKGNPAVLTEGEKKALALAQNGYTAVGIGGIYSWKIKKTEDLIPDLAAIDWTGRDVYIAFDYDEKPETRRNCDDARRRLAKALRAAGAKEVYNVELPPGPNGSKQGVDDFLVAHGAEAFQELVEKAQPVPANDIQPLHTPAGRTDSANAARLVAKFGDIIRWVGPWDKWLIWDGQRWKLDQELRIQALAKQVSAALWDELKSNDFESLDKDILRVMYDFCRKSNNAGGISAMVALARSEPGIAVSVDELDADPWLLNVENGTIDLRTGELREHRREDFITKLAPVTFDPSADCPTWLKFTHTIFAGKRGLIEYIQRVLGWSITGVIEEHLLTFLHGKGANGKSTFCELVMKMLGPDYSMKAPPDLLMAKRGESHPTERADLFGKRFVACIETENGRRLAEALVKELTGGDRHRVRRMREDFWEFAPTHHIWLCSNYKPVVVGTDEGIWRRIKLIPFDVVIPKSDQDKKLPAKLEAELSGILNWAIAGCLDWQRNGMQEPEVVCDETKEYRTEMDDVGQFIDGTCEQGDYIESATVLHEAFVEATGGHMSQKSFGAELKRRGFEQKRVPSGIHKGRHGWKGLRLCRTANTQEVADVLKNGAKRCQS